MESQMHHATTICTTILGDAPRFSKNAPRFRSMHQASFQNAPRKWEMHQAFSEMHQGKRENATGLSHSIKIVVLSQPSVKDANLLEEKVRREMLTICVSLPLLFPNPVRQLPRHFAAKLSYGLPNITISILSASANTFGSLACAFIPPVFLFQILRICSSFPKPGYPESARRRILLLSSHLPVSFPNAAGPRFSMH